MIITLFLLTALLSIVAHMGYQDYLVWVVNQPLELYIGILVSLVLLRISQALYKVWPAIRRLLVNVDRLSSKVDNLSVRVNNPGSPFNGGQKRKFSTGMKQPLPKRVELSPIIGKNSDPKSLYHSTLLRLHFKLENIQGMFSVKGGRPLVNILKGLLITAGARITPAIIRYICHFIVYMKKIYLSQGVVGLTKYLKACGVILQQSLGTHIVHDTGRLGTRVSKTRSGLPRFIPFAIRARIRKDDFIIIRSTLTLINIYRVFEYTGKLNLKTIYEPNKGSMSLQSIMQAHIYRFLKLFVLDKFSMSQIYDRLLNYSKSSAFAMFKGGPGVIGTLGYWNTMPWILLRSILALRQDKVLWESMETILNLLDYTNIKFAIKQATSVENIKISGDDFKNELLVKPLSYLGKLGLKEEAAGKIRVFAMVDAWTQWVLYPFHKVIFDILSEIPMDGTFDQVAPLKHIDSSKGLYSLDLSAATDRLPISLQKSLLGSLFGFEFSGAWANLLTHRSYRLHVKNAVEGQTKDYADINYSVGQPMGALSSWASLAFTHHFIVQCAAWHSGYRKDRLYTNYAILGDDIVIGDYKVVTQYLEMMKSLGVDIGIHKSLISHTGTALEFAKRTIYKGVDVSPVPLKEFYAATRHIGAFKELMKKFNVSFSNSLHALGAGWKVRSWLNKPIGKLSSRIRLLILATNIPQTQAEVLTFFNLGQAPVPQFKNDSEMIIQKFTETEIRRLTTKLMLSCQVGNYDPDAYGLEFMKDYFLTEFGIGKGPLKYEKRLLADVLTNLLRLLWHPAMLDNVAEAKVLLKQAQNIPKDDFVSLYSGFIELNDKIAARSPHVFATSRPNPAEIKGLLAPNQVRLWKRWSQIIQNTTSITHSSS